MKQALFLIFFYLSCQAIFSQSHIGLRGFYESPSEDHPEIFDNSIGGELIIKKAFGSQGRFVSRGGVTFLSRSFRFDSYPDYAIVPDRSTLLAVESQINLEHYQEYFFSLGLNFNILNRDDLKIYLGGDGLFGRYDFRYESFFEGFSQGDKAESGNLAGYRLRIGVDYGFSENFALNATSHWGKRSITSIDYFSLFDFGIGISYRIE